ncbi:MAG: type II toxin-antitoxin system prevent-host-death family antitoxin [bacterium]|nr:type II toxin-antitoxin system prevent-host-death family antitoxin [bacterium]
MRRNLRAADARTQLTEALRQVESGDEVTITRYGKPVAVLLGADRLQRLERAAEAAESARQEVAPKVPAAEGAGDGNTAAAGEPDREIEELHRQAAAVSLRRIDHDLARLPKKLRPVLQMIRANLFKRRLTVERIRAALRVGSHDLTTEFRHAVGAPIHRYLTDRRLECGSLLLVDTDLEVGTIARLCGYGGSESFSRAFKKRYGVRPPIYREFEGELSLPVASAAGPGRPPPAPRYLAGRATLPEGSRCAGCGGELETAATPLRVFEDLAPICDVCARDRAPELIESLGGEAVD